ncbi:MAG: lasso peptide biosynthesis PqqD family chaperone [Aliarcobacter sp.]|nr:lasso peptide biosynthesis PqqD family chaperone [Aliarcobacter sp.]
METLSIIKRNNDLLSSEMDDELVMMNLESNNYYGLNKIGKDIWEILEENQTLESLCNKLIEKYDVSFEECKNDITPFLEKLKESNIIEIS